MPGYYKRPEVTAEVFDADGYYRTGDVMAEIEPDRLEYVDRSKNVLKLSQGEFVAVCESGGDLRRRPAGASDLRLRQQRASQPARGDRPDARRAGALRRRQQCTQGRSERCAARDGSCRRAAVLRGAGRLPRSKPNRSAPPTDCCPASERFCAPGSKSTMASGSSSSTPNWRRRVSTNCARCARTPRTARCSTSVTRAAQAVLGSTDVEIDPDDHFTDLGGDSLSALTFANLLRDVLGVDVPVGMIVGPTSDLRQIAAYIEAERESGSKRPTFASVHGRGATVGPRRRPHAGQVHRRGHAGHCPCQSPT